MTEKKIFVEPKLSKYKEKFDEITKMFNDLGSHGVNTSGSGGSDDDKRSRCPLGFK